GVVTAARGSARRACARWPVAAACTAIPARKARIASHHREPLIVLSLMSPSSRAGLAALGGRKRSGAKRLQGLPHRQQMVELVVHLRGIVDGLRDLLPEELPVALPESMDRDLD